MSAVWSCYLLSYLGMMLQEVTQIHLVQFCKIEWCSAFTPLLTCIHARNQLRRNLEDLNYVMFWPRSSRGINIESANVLHSPELSHRTRNVMPS